VNKYMGRKYARKWRKMSNAVVHRDASWKRESCTARKRKEKSQSIVHHMERGEGFCKVQRTAHEPLETLTPLTDLLYTALVPSSMSLSPSIQRSRMLAPSTNNSMSLFTATLTMSAATFPSQATGKKIRKKDYGWPRTKTLGPCIL
jgi:hypothetical protein